MNWPLHQTLLDEIALAAAGVALIGLLVSVVLAVKLRGLRRSFAALEGPNGAETVLQAIGRSQSETMSLRRELAEARAAIDATRRDLADSLRHVSVVRYDAFGDMGGRMSFTAAMLDDAGDGLVISAINGRTEGRTYAKGIKAGKSEASLSPEEEQAIQYAMRGAAGAGRGAAGAMRGAAGVGRRAPATDKSA